MTARPYYNFLAVLLDSYLDQTTTQARLLKQLSQLRSRVDRQEGEKVEEVVDEHVLEEMLDEHVMEEVDVCVSSTAKEKKRVSSIRAIAVFTDASRGLFRH